MISAVAQRHIGWYSILIREVDPDSSTLMSVYKDGPDHIFDYLSPVQPIAGTMAAVVVESKRPIFHDGTRRAAAPQYEVFIQHLFDRGVSSVFFGPVIQDGEVIGVVTLTGDESHSHSAALLEAIEVICDSIAGALGRSRFELPLAKEVDSTVRSLEKVDDLLRFESFSDGIFERFSELASELIRFDRMSILFYVAERRQAETAFTTGAAMPLFEKGFRHSVHDDVAEVWLANSRAFFPGETMRRDRYVVDRLNPDAQSEIFKSWIVAPVIWKGERIGDLHFRAFDDDAYDQRDLDLSNLLADKVAGVISNARAITEARNELSLRESLTTLSELVSSTTSLQEIREPFGELATQLVGADRLSVTVWDEVTKMATNLLVYGPNIEAFKLGAHGPTRNPREFRWLTETKPYIIDKTNFMDSVASQWFYEMAAKAGMHSALVAPVLWQGEQIAALTFRSKIENHFGQYEIDIAAAIAGQIAGAVASKFALDERERWASERDSLAKMGQIVTSSSSLDDVFSRFTEIVNELIPTDRLGLTVLEEGGDAPVKLFNHGRALADLESGAMPASRGQISALLRRRRGPTILDEDTGEAREDISDANAAALPVGLRSWMAAPLFWHDELIGNLHFRSEKEDAYGPAELRLAGEIARQISGAVANSISLEKLERETNIQSVLSQIGKIVSSNIDLKVVLPEIEQVCQQIVEFDEFSIGSYISERDVLRRLYATGKKVNSGGYVGEESEHDTEFPAKNSASAGVIESRQPLVISPRSLDELDDYPQSKITFETGIRTFLTVALVSDDKVVGTLQLRSRKPDAYSQSDIDVVSRIAAQISGALAISLVSEQILLQATALDSADDAVVITSFDGKIIWGNEALAKHTGWPLDEVIGLYPNIWSSDDPAQEEIEADLQSKIRVGEGWAGEHLNKRKDGTEFYEHLTITPVRDKNGDVTHFVGIKRDITERIRSEEQRQRVAQIESENRELQQMATTRSEFLSTVSHELRTPLTAVSAFADLLKNSRSENLTERQLDHIDVVRRSSKHLAALIDDLLDISQADSGRLILKKIDFEVSSLVDELVESSTVLISDKNQTIELDDRTDGATINADRTRVIQILSNLVMNASKYSNPGDPIRITVETDDEHIVFGITDYGSGVAEADQKLMFNAFYRGHSDEDITSDGSGLGLAVVRALVDLHDGSIFVDSERGQGTTITVSIPRNSH